MSDIEIEKKLILLEQKISYIEKELTEYQKDFVDHLKEEAVELKEIKEELKKISEIIITGKTTWRTISIIGAIIIGLISIMKFGIDVFRIK